MMSVRFLTERLITFRVSYRDFSCSHLSPSRRTPVSTTNDVPESFQTEDDSSLSSPSSMSINKLQIQSLPPDLVNILTSTTVDTVCFSGRPSRRLASLLQGSSLWDRIQSYKSGYVEKTILLNREVAEQIAQTVAVHTRGNKETLFYDADGGLCHIASAVQKMDIFKSVSVFEKDMNFSVLHNYAKSEYLDPNTEIHELNVNKIVPDAVKSCQKQFLSPILDHIPSSGSKSEDVPSYTLLSTVSHGFIKYLTSKLLYRDNPFSEFYSSRPEFFFIVPSRTYFHLSLSYHEPDPLRHKITEEEMRFRNSELPKKALYNLFNNVLFQTLFDFYLVDVLPRHAYYPWKQNDYEPHQRVKPMKRSERIVKANQENLMMLYVRPKKPEDINVGDPKYFSHFLFHLFKNKNKFVCSLLEEWSTGWGLLVIDLGYSTFTQVKDLNAEEMVNIYQHLIQLPNFDNSNFIAEADFVFEDNLYDDEVDELEMEQYRVKFWKRISSGQS